MRIQMHLHLLTRLPAGIDETQRYRCCGPVIQVLWPSDIGVVAQRYRCCGPVIQVLWPSDTGVVALCDVLLGPSVPSR